MDQILQFVLGGSGYVPWVIMALILLAGCNIPISTDIIMVLAAFVATTNTIGYAFAIYSSLLVGSYFSAWISYWMGRKMGVKLLRIRYFSKMFSEKRLKKIGGFYEKHGLLTLLIGRFIPFGIRNCIFFTTGMSRSSFEKFILQDALACFTWTTASFLLYYSIGGHYELLIQKVKLLNIFIFLGFSVTAIGLFCYKKYNKKEKSFDKNIGLKS